jgi:hypothetical protein
MAILPADLQYVIFPGQIPEAHYSKAYCEAFRCWSKVWEQTLLELDGSAALFSDDFERQTEVQALMHGDRCVALLLLHEVDFRFPTAKRDSWFKIWPESAIKKLTEDGPRILVGSGVTVDAEFRGDLGQGLRLKDLLLKLMVKTLLERDVDALCGTTRNNRGVNVATYKSGATQIASGHKLHGVEVDLVAYYRKRILKSMPLETDLTVESIWRNRVEFTNQTQKQALRLGGTG